MFGIKDTEVEGVRPRQLRRAMILAGFGAIMAAAMHVPSAQSAPGQCGGGFGMGNGGHWCDGPAAPDGTWMHTETICVLGICGTNSYRVRPVPTSVDPRGWTPA